MTFSSSQPHNIALCAADTAQILGDVSGGFSPVFQAVLRAALMMLARYSTRREPKTRKMLIAVLVLLLALFQGTRDEKRAFLKRLIAQHNEIQARVYARYKIWRQRKCWMWGGGFRAGVLAAFRSGFTSACDKKSFDALIPD